MSMSKKDFEAIAAAVNQNINQTGNSSDKQAIIRVLANTFGSINPNFDRARFFNACGYDTLCVSRFYQGDIADALRQYKEAHPEALMGDGILAMAQMVADAGGNPGELIAFATHNPIPETLNNQE
jgi:hypothetical protein